ncbi:MAG: hypothetical protein WCK89_21195 [bacterium]
MKGEDRAEGRDRTAVELYRVRHTCSGLYVGGYTLMNGGAGLVGRVELHLVEKKYGWIETRGTAEKIANFWIAVTGDHGIEIEPVEG